MKDDLASVPDRVLVVTVSPGESPQDAALRQRTRDQLQLIQERGNLLIATATGDLADFDFICDPDHVLLAPEASTLGADAETRLQSYFSGRDSDFEGTGGLTDDQPRDGLSRRYRLPPRRQAGPQDLLQTLAELDRDPAFGPGFATPDHFVHVTPGNGSCCPATEPEETGLTCPWPENTQDPRAGKGVNVVVIDTGWYPPAQALSWLHDVDGDPDPGAPDPPGELLEYAGHGTFVAGVVRAMAPECNLHVLGFDVDRTVHGGGVLESQLVSRLDDAMALDPAPDLINLSAGCPTRLGLPMRSFEDWWADLVTRAREEDPEADPPAQPRVVLVAAAGNDSTWTHFFPASFDWAVGVGSLDYDGQISSFSNYGYSVDVFALGRNIINAFPKGHYTCREKPNTGDHRDFTQMLARWSGTSFAAPLVTGLIAAEMTGQVCDARTARDSILASGTRQLGPVSTLVTYLPPPHWPPWS